MSRVVPLEEKAVLRKPARSAARKPSGGSLLRSALLVLSPCVTPALLQVDPAAGKWRGDVGAIRTSGLVDPGVTDEDAWRALETFARWDLALTGVEVRVEHEPGTSELRLESRNGAQVEEAQRRLAWGVSPFHMYLVADDGDVKGGLAAESARFEAWCAKNPSRSHLEYNADPGRDAPGVAWFPTRFAEKTGKPMAVRIPRDTWQEFSGVDIARIYRTSDRYGSPAMGFELVPGRVDDFAAFTGRNTDRRLAVVLRGEIRSCPTLNAKLVGGGIIEGRFTDKEVNELIELFRAGGAQVQREPFPLFQVLRLGATAAFLLLAGFIFWRARRNRRRVEPTPS